MNTPSGDSDIVSFDLWGYSFRAISAGPLFTFNPSISFMVNFDPLHDKEAKTRIDAVWAKLVEGGTVLMPLDKYPFSERYGWLQDKYGLSWQLILTDPEGEERPPIIPRLCSSATCVAKPKRPLTSIFPSSSTHSVVKLPVILPGWSPTRKERSCSQTLSSRVNGLPPWTAPARMTLPLTRRFRFIVQCDTQEEIDYYWETLSAVPEAEQCGWLKDKYGVSWQIVPTAMDAMLARGAGKDSARDGSVLADEEIRYCGTNARLPGSITTTTTTHAGCVDQPSRRARLPDKRRTVVSPLTGDIHPGLLRERRR